MHDELLISQQPALQRMARLTGGVLQALEIEQPGTQYLVGNIYRGRVARLLPGLNAGFVDLAPGLQGLLTLAEAKPPGATLKLGESLLVQVSRDATGAKKAQLSAAVNLPGPHWVLVAGKPRSGVSRRITDAAIRRRLGSLAAAITQDLRLAGATFVARTAAAEAPDALLRDEAHRLAEAWNALHGFPRYSGEPRLLLAELPFAQRVIRDLGRALPERISVDTSADFAALHAWCTEHRPAVLPSLEHYVGIRPLFAARGVDAAISALLRPQVSLPSGGSLVIEHTAAMTTVDVNSGSDTHSERAQLTANLEAVQALPRQLRLRGVGGMIAVDFISLSDASQWRELVAALQQSVLDDPAMSRVHRVDRLGVVLLTRKQRGLPLASVLKPVSFADDAPGQRDE
ncbi:MAG: ribonuclease E/G [Haliea sp.]|nr:ribonuclease E/G [Haliea sp.]